MTTTSILESADDLYWSFIVEKVVSGETDALALAEAAIEYGGVFGREFPEKLLRELNYTDNTDEAQDALGRLIESLRV